jgi:hypothetical protein
LRHSLHWQGPGDVDSMVIAPTGVAVVIETKTRNYHDGHLKRVLEQAAWLSRRRQRWCRNGLVAVLCGVRVRGVEHVEADVIVVAIDRLIQTVRNAAEIMHRGVYGQTEGPSRVAAVAAQRGRGSAVRPTGTSRWRWWKSLRRS